MACRIITIALSTGAQAEQIGSLVAQQLGFRYVNDEIILRASEKAGISAELVEQEEHSPPLIARIMRAMATMASSDPDAFLAPDALWRDPSPSYRRLIQEAIRETASEGNAVIAAHAASIYLAGTPGLLRVFITASPDVRAQRLGSTAQLDPKEARQQIDHADRERQAYLKRFYNVGQELPTHYDLVLNTDLLAPPVAAQMIAHTAQAMR